MGKLVRLPVFRPFSIGHFRFLATDVEVVGPGRPSFAEFQAAFEFATRAHKSANWWIAGLVTYGNKRPDWKDLITQVMEDFGIAFKTLETIKYVGENCPIPSRNGNVDFTLHKVVAKLPPKQQVRWLAEAEENDWSVSELQRAIRIAGRARVLDGQAPLNGMFRVIYADPPWFYGDSGVITDGDAYGRAERHYPSLTMEALSNLPVEAHALPDSVLFCWVTAPMLYENPGPREVIEAWGFKPKTGMVWDKVLHNFGHYVSVRHELLIIATRGSCTPDAPTPMPDSVQTIRRGDVHSEKPDEFRQIITALYTRGPYLELFGRTARDGWSVFGNDSRLWGEQHEAAVRT